MRLHSLSEFSIAPRGCSLRVLIKIEVSIHKILIGERPTKLICRFYMAFNFAYLLFSVIALRLVKNYLLPSQITVKTNCLNIIRRRRAKLN